MPTRAWPVIARKELGDKLRNRWVWTVAVVLAMSVVAIAFFGTAPAGVVVKQASGAVLASLTSLTVYLVPLLALVLGCGAIIDEKARGTLDLVLMSSVSEAEYFLGTFVGFALALATAIVVGFGVPGVMLTAWLALDLVPYVLLTLMAVLLGVVFLGVSFLLSILSRDRGRAVVSSVLVWIVSVLVFDLALLGILIVSKGGVPPMLFSVLLLLNPTDAFRILCLRLMTGAASPLGLADVMPFAPGPAVLAAALLLWATVPLVAGYFVFRRRLVHDTLA